MNRNRFSEVRRRVANKVREAVEQGSRALVKAPDAPLAPEGEEPPVVARLMVEIRSDGSRTIARGAIEDAVTEERVAIRAEGTTPAQLASSLAKSLFTVPLMAAQAMRALKRGEKAAGKPQTTAPERRNGQSRDEDGD